MTFVCKHGHQTSRWERALRPASFVLLLSVCLMGECCLVARSSPSSSTPTTAVITRVFLSSSASSNRTDPPPPQKCLFLDGALASGYCEPDGDAPPPPPRDVHLPHCSHYTMDRVAEPGTDCRTDAQRLLDLDSQASAGYRGFASILDRFDCRAGYSVNWNCVNCKEAYLRWFCAMQIPFMLEGQRVRPCRTFCHEVEQKCPYFQPFVRDQYAGEPTFKCIDRNIPDLPTITQNSAYGPPGQCYELCHVDGDLSGSPCPPVVVPAAAAATRDSSNATTSPQRTGALGAYASGAAPGRTHSLYLLLIAMVTSTGLCRTLATTSPGRTNRRNYSRTRTDLCR